MSTDNYRCIEFWMEEHNRNYWLYWNSCRGSWPDFHWRTHAPKVNHPKQQWALTDLSTKHNNNLTFIGNERWCDKILYNSSYVQILCNVFIWLLFSFIYFIVISRVLYGVFLSILDYYCFYGHNSQLILWDYCR